ncbi:MAG TPA: hypothetical protein VH439_17455 [Gemmatimonadales bacterium]|jgi:hypothetical protein
MTATALTHALRPELPPLPLRMKKLPIDARGYPVPWFVAYIDGKPDFRIMDIKKLARVLKGDKRCWVCGEKLGAQFAFTVGPMCAVNRISSEPPSHRECAWFSAISCPFLSRPHMRRREAGLPDDMGEAAGVMIGRNPGVALVWVTRSYTVVDTYQKDQNHWLFQMGDPVTVYCYAEGRPATKAEVRASVESGLPLLRAACDKEHVTQRAEAHRALEVVIAKAYTVLGIA